jgi:hypothetical protein
LTHLMEGKQAIPVGAPRSAILVSGKGRNDPAKSMGDGLFSPTEGRLLKPTGRRSGLLLVPVPPRNPRLAGGL